ncbi:GGDEF domain-containing protein [Lysobacter sp. TY2-98]|uniref:GGDEF domain-containing protein n=1 Tax=Lysobacter sp. TY2-98 TaxID=2290922 RepID=UPI0013B45C4A|nr:GGDEF domain-containing protein [Lysobacter sp. TY2-98]
MRIRVLLLLTVLPSMAFASGRVDDILREQHRHGYRSAAVAIDQLQSADDRPTATSDAGMRMRYNAAVLHLAVTSRRPRMVATARDALAVLDGMARDEACTRCASEARIARASDALTRRETDEAEGYLRGLETRVPDAMADLSGRLHYQRARLYNLRGNYVGGVAEALRASELFEGVGDASGALMSQALMVSMSTALADYPRAEAIGRRAYAEAQRIGFNFAMASLRLNMAYAYGRAGRSDDQLHALEEAIALSHGQEGMEEFEAISLSNLADHWLIEKDYAKALDAARRGEALARRTDDPRSLSYALTNDGVATAHLGDIDTGLRRVREAIAIAERTGARGDVIGMNGELVGILKLAGRYREAFEALEQVASLQADLTRQERDKTLLEMQERYSAQSRQREIDRLGAANRIKQAELAARTWQQRLWAALAVVLALAAVPLVQLIKRVRNDNRRLSGDVAMLAEQSLHDPLTGVANRRQCHALMAQHAGNPAAAVGLLLLDVDFFKKVNDAWGHAAGDRVLIEIATRLRGLVRQDDAVVRWGGEEFALVLPGIGEDALAALASRVLQAIGTAPVDLGGHLVDITVSVGAVVHPMHPGGEWQQAMHVADLALYLSKSAGRNRATLVMDVAVDADMAELGRDLAGAQARGEVQLQSVVGPSMHASVDRPDRAMA